MMMPANAGGSPGHHQRPISQLLPEIRGNIFSPRQPHPPEMVNIMSEHQRKHAKQAIQRDFLNRMGKPITVTFKRPVTPLRALLVDDMQQRWDEIRLVHEIRKFL